jgi:hypothetical protein
MKLMLLKYWLIGPFLLMTVGITAWSWVLIDPNFTLFDHADWTRFRALAISVGYFQRQWSANMYVILISLLTTISYSVVRWYKGSVWPLLIAIGIIAGLFSYPALSHDLFNYIFDARIVTHYHANPYLYKPLDFPADSMLRFMHWVHRTYPYGPTYLLISLIPSFLGLGIFSLTFLLFKALHVVLFVISGWALSTMHKKAALIFITSPLIIVEGLVNTHNDFIALAFGIFGLYLINNHKQWWTGSIMFLISGLIKYFTLPMVLFSLAGKELFVGWRKPNGKHTITFQTWHLVLVGLLTLIVYIVLRQEIQPWYFLNIFVLLPFAPHIFEKCTIFFTGLMVSYYPYVLGGEWGQGGDVEFKRSIIMYSFLLNVVFLLMYFSYKRFKMRRA